MKKNLFIEWRHLVNLRLKEYGFELGQTLCVIIGLVVSAAVTGQKSVVIVDEERNAVIGATLTINNEPLALTNYDGVLVLNESLIDLNDSTHLVINHLSFDPFKFKAKDFALRDTFVLKTIRSILPSIDISAKGKGSTKKWYRYLNRVVQHHRESISIADTLKYKYYLESLLNGIVKEKVKVLFRMSSVNRQANPIPITGEIWFDHNTPFINIGTENWIMSFHPFDELSGSCTHLLNKSTLNDVISNLRVLDIDSHFVYLELQDTHKHEYVNVKVNRLKNQLEEVSVKKNMHRDVFFLRIGTNDTLWVGEIRLLFKLADNHTISQYNYVIDFEGNTEEDVSVRGSIEQTDFISRTTILHLGSYSPNSFYEYIVNQPVVDEEALTNEFNTGWYSGFDLTHGSPFADLKTNDYSRISNTVQFVSSYHRYNTNMPLDIKDYNYYEPPVVNPEDVIPVYQHVEDSFDISWVVGLYCAKDSMYLSSIPSIWSKKKNILFALNDIEAAYLANFGFDLFEKARIDLSNIDLSLYTNKKNVIDTVRLRYRLAKENVTSGMFKARNFEQNFRDLVDLNGDNHELFGVDRIENRYLDEVCFNDSLEPVTNIPYAFIKLASSGLHLKPDIKKTEYLIKAKELCQKALRSLDFRCLSSEGRREEIMEVQLKSCMLLKDKDCACDIILKLLEINQYRDFNYGSSGWRIYCEGYMPHSEK